MYTNVNSKRLNTFLDVLDQLARAKGEPPSARAPPVTSMAAHAPLPRAETLERLAESSLESPFRALRLQQIFAIGCARRRDLWRQRDRADAATAARTASRT
jgi:hypothetical protein